MFKLSFISFLFYLMVVTLLISLGFWQLGRADEKKVFLEKQKISVEKDVINIKSALATIPEDLRYRKIELTGEYDEQHQFLIDNQIVNGQAGYFVMTPLKIDGVNKTVLVNRGWVALNKDRQILPKLSVTTLNTTLKGRINNFPVVGIRLAGAEIPTEGWPSVVQVVDINILSKKLSVSLLPFQIELNADMNNGYKREWKKSTIMPPEKHIAYAVQWFGLAITLTVLFIWFSIKVK
ncbi:MAG: SURF1 family protein [Methylococcales bacterium]|nr:SURF1 family protein [Methylococcales bacterium]